MLRLLESQYPDFLPSVSPLIAISFVGAMYLPRKWGWLVGPFTLLLTDLAFLKLNQTTDGAGSMFSGVTLVVVAVYALAGGLGILISQRKSLGKILGGSVLCSLAFYFATNTFAWWHDLALHLNPGYAPTLAGWWQANTVGLPGYIPSLVFLRNGVLGDLFFTLVLLLVLDRGLLFGQAPNRTPRPASV